VLTEQQNSCNYGRADFKLCISCNNGIRLQESNIAVGFVVKGFMCGSSSCGLNGTSCINPLEKEIEVVPDRNCETSSGGELMEHAL
jgi:hypothetical protein